MVDRQQDFIYLASHSPHRRELLDQIGVAYQPVTVSVDETPLAGEAPAAYKYLGTITDEDRLPHDKLFADRREVRGNWLVTST